MINFPLNIIENQSAIQKICIDNNVEKLYLFGSGLRSDFSSKSDIDLLIQLNEENPVLKGEILMKTWSEFESIFNRKVDLLTSLNIKNPILKKSIESNIQLIYERKN